MPFYTSEQILNQALDEATGTLKTSGGSGAASATAANQTTTNDRLGTPGTGEPAHAGGSTGLIGWARDILAKIAAFGTAAAPSADVLSVQYPNTYAGKASLMGLNEALTVDTLGAAQIAITSSQSMPPGMSFAIEGTNSNAASPIWVPLRLFTDNFGDLIYTLTSGAIMTAGDVFRVSCAGFNQVRIRITAYGSGSWEVVASRVYAPSLTTNISQPMNAAASPLFVNNATAVYYTDTTTPLAANAWFTGSARTMLPGNNRFTANFYSDTGSVSLACYILSSQNGVSYLQNDFGATANPVVTVSIPRTANYYQITMMQSATPATVTRILSSQTP